MWAYLNGGEPYEVVERDDGFISAANSTGDYFAESELYRRFAPRVRLYGLRHLRNEDAARDLVQQVMLLTIEKLRSGSVRDADQIALFVLGVSRTMPHDLRASRVTLAGSLRGAKYHQQFKLLYHIVKSVWLARPHEEAVTGYCVDSLVTTGEPGPTCEDIVKLVFGLWLLQILAPWLQPVHTDAQVAGAEELLVQTVCWRWNPVELQSFNLRLSGRDQSSMA